LQIDVKRSLHQQYINRLVLDIAQAQIE
jgi:hypothetical protein